MSKHVPRRLAAILAADVAGYSRLMEADEVGTLAALKELRHTMFNPRVEEHGGRIVKLMGDGAIVEFPSVVDAVKCSVAAQRALRAHNAQTPADKRIELRVGVHLGDVLIEGDDLYGDGVNIAARLQELSDPGGVVLSATAHEHVAGKTPIAFSDAGERTLKNIARPLRIFRWEESEAGAPLSSAPGAAPDPPGKPSIAVLPFDNMSGDPEQEHFADGVVEALTAALSRIRSFFVIARTSAFTYKGRAKNIRDIGRELGVAYALEGSVQRAGGRVRITVQLIETDKGAHLWAEKYDGAIEDLFDLQDRITERVAGALQPSIRLAEIERARRKRPQDLGAYDYAMRAMSHVWTLEKEEAEKALGLLEKALALDPDYPLALALAAWCWAQRTVYNWVEEIAEARARAAALAERAANLSADDPLILAVLGAVHTIARNFGAARVLLERSVALDPNGAWAFSRLGWLEVYTDRPEAARLHFEHALRLSPFDPMNFNNYVGLAASHQVNGDDAAAAEQFLRALRERPNALWIHRNLAPALYGAGRHAEAQASGDVLKAAYPDLTIARFREAMVFSPAVMDRVCGQLRALGVREA